MMGLVADLFDWVVIVWSLEVGEGGLPLQEETLLAVISDPGQDFFLFAKMILIVPQIFW